MAIIVGVRFRNAGKLYYFEPLETGAQAGDTVIVETARGQEMGEVVTGPAETPDESIPQPLRPVIRVASPEDIAHKADNQAREAQAFDICKERITAHQLPMKLVSCEYTFDNTKLLFYFTSDRRVDFRALVKDLASVFHIRIELRQIGVRDEARMMGGLGICGRPLCCTSFLGDFHPVSIKMAKEQNLSLNPIKISGACGRLMCCLQYEEEFYEKTSRQLPRPGKPVRTPDGDGIVADVSILNETVRVRLNKGNDTFELRDYPAAEVTRLTGGYQPAVAMNVPRDEDDEADPEIIKVLQASEMDVPDEMKDEASIAELLEDEPSAGDDNDVETALPPKRADRPAPRSRQRAPRAEDENARDQRRDAKPQAKGGRPPKRQQDNRPARRNDAQAPAPNEQPDKPAAPAAPPAPPAAPATAKRDPWTVPEEYRVKPQK